MEQSAKIYYYYDAIHKGVPEIAAACAGAQTAASKFGTIAQIDGAIPLSYQRLSYGLYGLGIQKDFFDRSASRSVSAALPPPPTRPRIRKPYSRQGTCLSHMQMGGLCWSM